MGATAVELANPDTYAHGFPHDIFQHLRDHDPVSWQAESAGRGFWAVTRYHDVMSVLRAPHIFSSWRGSTMLADAPPAFLTTLRQSMISRDPPDHTMIRRLVNKAFSARRVAQLENRIAQHARTLVARVRHGDTFDFAEDVAGAMPLFVICEILGIPQDDRQHLYTLTETMLSCAHTDAATSLQTLMDTTRDMRAYGAALGQRKRAAPADDLLSDLLAGEVDGRRLTDGEYQAFFMLLFNAGSETTRSLLCYALNLLIDRPGDWARLRADASLLPTAIEEMVRYESSVIQFRRTATQDVNLGTRRIAENDKVVVFFPSANRDASVFANPHDFVMTRSPNPHVGFGFGAHFCLGAPLARIESKHILLQVLSQLGHPERVEPMAHTRTNFVRGVKHFRVRFTAS